MSVVNEQARKSGWSQGVGSTLDHDLRVAWALMVMHYLSNPLQTLDFPSHCPVLLLLLPERERVSQVSQVSQAFAVYYLTIITSLLLPLSYPIISINKRNEQNVEEVK